MNANIKDQATNISSMSGFPSGEAGYELGVSACYAGFIGDYLIVAGGCNFPEPGKKKYYSGIYAAKVTGKEEALTWEMIGNLPEPAAYGGVVSTGDSLVLVGGCNTEHSLKTVLSIHLDQEKGTPILNVLPELPCTVDNMGVCLLETRLFVVGGNQDGCASASLLSLELGKEKEWTVENNLPDNPRVQPVCAAYQGELFIWGGFYENGKSSVVPTTGLRYDLTTKCWTMLPAPRNLQGTELTLTGATAMLVVSSEGEARIVCAGGVNREIFWDAISGTYSMVAKADYLKKDISWYKFNDCFLTFNLKTGQWDIPFPENSLLARAGAQVALKGETLYYVGGELKPGLRSPGIVKVTP